MGPTLTIPMDGSLRLKILANQDHLLPIIDEVRALNLGGASLSVNTQYKESQITIHREDGKKIAIFRYAIDSDDESTNGRIYVEDHFVLDEHKKLVDFQRSLSAGPGSLKQDFWFHLLKRLNQKKIPTKDQNSVQRFFQNVVLKLPEAPPEEKKKIDFVSLNAKVALPEHATFVFKTPLENTFYSRLSLSLSKTLSLFSWNSRELDLFAKGFVYNTKGWSEENPYYQLLLVEGKLNPDQTKLVEGFNRLSTGDWQAAKQQWELIRMRVPVANELLFTLREYEQAQKNLGYLPILKNLSLEALDLQRKKEGGGFFANLSPSFSVSLEFLNELFTDLENQISSGKSISLDQAFSQIFNEANPAERAQLSHLKSAQFAQGMFSQLLQASALPSDFFAQILSSFAKETMTRYGYLSTQALSFNYLASHPLERFSQKLVEVPVGMESFASSWMQSHDLRLAYDQTFASSQKFIADPFNLAAFLLGQGAFGMGQNVGIASWGTRSAQTRLFNALLGLSLEVPTFEIASRGLHQMFVEKVSWEDLDQALFKGFLSFSALRGLGSLQSKNAAALLQQSPQELKPLLPFFAQVHSFGILHGLNQFERALMKDPTFENPYTSLMDASFFAHAGLSHQVGEKIWGYNLLKGSDAIFRVDRIRKELNRKTYQFPSQAIWLRGARVGPESRALTVPLRNMPPVEAVAPESIPPELTPTNEIVVPLEQEMPLRWMIPPGAPLLRPNHPLLGSVPNLPTAPRNVVHQAFIPHVGETAAFTDVGLCKKHLKNSKLPPVNEDAFGIGTDHQGNPVFVVADGLGGHGRGDEASKIMVENLLENLSKKPLTLAEGFLAAHEKISQFNLAQSEADKAAATVGGAVRINPDGTFEVALVGDIRFWILRPQLDGSFKILEPYYPDYRAGAMRELGKFKTTLEMHSSQVPGSNDVSSCLGAPETVFDVVEARSPGRNDQILNTAVALSSEEGSQPQRELFKAQQGDGFILMSDGVATLFDEAQLAETIRGLNTAQDIQKALQQETKKRLNLYLNGAYGVLNDKRVLLEDGRYIDRRGNIFASASLQDRQVLAHVGPDNTTALVFIYNPQLQEQLPETPPLREAAKSIVPGEPLVHLDSPTTFKIPEVHVSYEGQTQKLIFNPAHPRLMFGTEFQPTLFPPKNKWLSRQHFSVEIAKVNQQWGYNIRVSSRYGLLVDGYQAPQNHTLFFAPESQCEIRSVKALDVDGKPIWDNPIVLQLPKIETILPSWMDPPLKD